MDVNSIALWMLAQEARALLTRLHQLKPFSLQMPMVIAAAVPPAAQIAIESHMISVRHQLRAMVHSFLQWLQKTGRRPPSPAEAQRRFTFLKMRFNSVISQFEIFADVLTQRAEHQTGVWVAGLDDLAAEALELPGRFYKPPAVVCYVDRGHGAAIRRARTRLPGGESNPVAIIRVPRERMVGSGIASSLVHEVGHQAAELLGLLPSLRPLLKGMQSSGGPHRLGWQLWERWISEIVPDFWSVARLGITGTMGLIGVASLPRPFVFRVDPEDPHPAPWIRVKLSCAMGEALYPHPQWARLAMLWESLYPVDGASEQVRQVFGILDETMPALVSLLVNHRPRSLRGKSLAEVMSLEERQPARLASYYAAWGADPERLGAAPPSIAFAVIGQARAEGKISPEQESSTLANLLTYWAVRSALDLSAICATAPMSFSRRNQAVLPPGFSVN
jgi:hypothetical protein